MDNLLNKIICTTAENYLSQLPDNSIDLIITSPPYDNLRDYNGFKWDFETIANHSYRVLKQGGVLVWVIGDKYTKGSKGLTSKRQCIYFVDCVGFRLHDEIIWHKSGINPQKPVVRYSQSFENCFVFSKDKPKSLNLELYKESQFKHDKKINRRQTNGIITSYERKNHIIQPIQNVWYIPVGYMKTSKDKLSYKHPAMFPEELAKRHILTWSNENDIVLDYFMGSGTTAKMALLNNRKYMGCDISQEYVDLANERLGLYKFNPQISYEDTLTAK